MITPVSALLMSQVNGHLLLAISTAEPRVARDSAAIKIFALHHHCTRGSTCFGGVQSNIDEMIMVADDDLQSDANIHYLLGSITVGDGVVIID